uniref:Neuroguidin n=1 Tax=Aceria tosichella TaxID=561515 RepID=A0A6G1SPT2_9ACAR
MTNDITIINAKDQTANEKSLEVCLQEDSVQEQAKSARELFSSLQSELDELEDDLKDGLSYLDMKNDTLLSYMIDLCNIVLRKVRCDTISGHASVERSVYYRIILEKIKAIDQRLAYQLNKVISLPEEAAEENQGVNVNNLDIEIGSDDESDDQDEKEASSSRQHKVDSDEDEDDDEDDEFDGSVDDEDDQEHEEFSDVYDDVGKQVKSKAVTSDGGKDKKPVGIYKPPKLRSVAYSDGKAKNNTKRRQDYDAFEDLDDDDNEDIVDETHVHRDNERTKYEEENYTRLPDMNPKKAKRKLKAKNMSNKGKKKFKGNKRKNKW